MTYNKIIPQKGFQMDFTSSVADIVIGGAAAGVGKTFALLLEPLRFSDNPEFGSIIFRRTSPMISTEGGLWDSSSKLYMSLGNPPTPVESKYKWIFPSGAKLQFRHLQYDKDRFNYQGAEIPLIGFDELTHFTQKQFLYLLSRNRSTCGVRPYVRATTNPEPFGWVKDLIQWFIYPDDYKIEHLQGFPIPERAGKLRYFTKDGDKFIWGNSPMQVYEKAKHIITIDVLKSLKASGGGLGDLIKSITFIPGSIYDNKALLGTDPAYLGNLMAQSAEEKAKLLSGCWKYKPGEDELYYLPAVNESFSNDFIPYGKNARDKYLIADIAMEGADKFVLWVWDGWRCVHIEQHDKTDSTEILNIIKGLCKTWGIPQRNICYDADGLGSYIGGFLKVATPYHGGGRPVDLAIKGTKDKFKENFKNLRSQCFYHSARRISNSELHIEPQQFKNQIIKETKAIRKVPSSDGKKAVMPKDQIKKILGHSPDFADCLAMREYMAIKPRRTGGAGFLSSY